MSLAREMNALSGEARWLHAAWWEGEPAEAGALLCDSALAVSAMPRARARHRGPERRHDRQAWPRSDSGAAMRVGEPGDACREAAA